MASIWIFVGLFHPSWSQASQRTSVTPCERQRQRVKTSVSCWSCLKNEITTVISPQPYWGYVSWYKHTGVTSLGQLAQTAMLLLVDVAKMASPLHCEMNLPGPWSSSLSHRLHRHQTDCYHHRYSNRRVFHLCLASRFPQRPPCFSPQRVVRAPLRKCGKRFAPQWMAGIDVLSVSLFARSHTFLYIAFALLTMLQILGILSASFMI